MQKIIIFDFDGVLAITLDDTLYFAAEACRELGTPCQPSFADLDALETMSFDDFGRQLGVPEDLVQEFTRRCLERFANKVQPPDIVPSMGAVVTQLAQTCQIGIVTGNTTPVVEKFLDQNGLRQAVTAIADISAPGTRADKIVDTSRVLAPQGGVVYFVGDAISDIRAAAEAGAISVAATWGHQSPERLRGANPDYIADSPLDLLKILECRFTIPIGNDG